MHYILNVALEFSQELAVREPGLSRVSSYCAGNYAVCPSGAAIADCQKCLSSLHMHVLYRVRTHGGSGQALIKIFI